MARPIFSKLVATIVLTACAAGASAQQAQPDKIELTNGQILQGKVEKVAAGQVQFNIGVGSRPVPFNQIKSVTMTPPPAFASAKALFEKQQFMDAARSLIPIVEAYKGLPTPWVQTAMSMLGDSLVEVQQAERAQAAYADLKRFYPNAVISADRLAMMNAKIAIANKKFGEAKAILEPIATAALTKKEITRQDGATYGQVFLAMGQIYEDEKKEPEALQSYLRTVTVFYQDAAATATAQAKADALREKNPSLVAP